MEALIAIVLLSMCALAYAALQLRGVSANSSSLWRSKAVMLAYEMSDRMRANRSGVTAGNYNSLLTPVAVTSCGATSSCTPDKMAGLDFYQWNTALAAELPSGAGVVCIDSTPDDGTAAAPACDGIGATLAVKVFWKERADLSRLSVAVRP
ncbi:MAG: type IV pilus modification protein PilV [Burkholderiales bacterium]|nr:type IV pilus modification protein PilV [Burkholderiales bacterium]